MEDYIYQIRGYLPIKFADSEANDFLKYLEETYLENIKNKKYQFAFMAFHMLYMIFCYKTEWFLKTQNNRQINQNLENHIKKNKKAFFNVLFDLSVFSEKETFENLLSSLGGFNSNDIDSCKIHVTRRNHCAHASGKIQYNEADISYIISDELKYTERMQGKIKNELGNFFESFLANNWNKSLIGGDIENIFIERGISRKDLEVIVGMNLALFKRKSDNEKVIFQKILYLVFINEAQKYLELDKNIFLEKLPMFIYGLEEEISIRKDEDEKKVSKQEIIEDHLVPIISEFDDGGVRKAERILNL